jgi:hypothetical protein
MTGPLGNLHDFYQPPPPAWTPQTIGWYILFSVVGILALWAVIHHARKWIHNRYRREALRELAVAPPAEISALLKRTALTVWPRETVASLSGESWIGFLSQSEKESGFDRAPANRVEEIALRTENLSAEDENALRDRAASWIRRHRVQT